MAVINFKSVGEKSTDPQFLQEKEKPLIGIRTPLQISYDQDSPFLMRDSLEDQIQDNLKNLILTNHGERLGYYDLGANLKPLTMDFSSYSYNDSTDAFEEEIASRIKNAVDKYMSYVKLQTFESKPLQDDNSHVGKLLFKITYDIESPTLNVQGKSLEMTLFLGG